MYFTPLWIAKGYSTSVGMDSLQPQFGARETETFIRSSGKMPQAVREALITVFQQEGKMTREEAEISLVKMEKDSRYKQETW